MRGKQLEDVAIFSCARSPVDDSHRGVSADERSYLSFRLRTHLRTQHQMLVVCLLQGSRALSRAADGKCSHHHGVESASGTFLSALIQKIGKYQLRSPTADKWQPAPSSLRFTLLIAF